MTATERFFEMARKKAHGHSGSTSKPSDNAISKKRPSLWVAFSRAAASLQMLAGMNNYLTRTVPSGLLRDNSNAVYETLVNNV